MLVRPPIGFHKDANMEGSPSSEKPSTAHDGENTSKKQTKSVLTAATVLQSLIVSGPSEATKDDDASTCSSDAEEEDKIETEVQTEKIEKEDKGDEEEKDNEASQKRMPRGDVPMSFPQKLMEILEDKKHSDVISWLPHGKAFIIYKKKKFEADVMPTYFKQSKFTSFTRKLNRWGFTRVKKGPEAGAYYHEFFKRGNVRLSMQMCCVKVHDRPAVRPQKHPAGMSGGSPSFDHVAASIAAKMQMMRMGDPSPVSSQNPFDQMAFATAQAQAQAQVQAQAQGQVQSQAGGLQGQMGFDPVAMAAASNAAAQARNNALEAELLRARQQQMMQAAQMMPQGMGSPTPVQPNKFDMSAEAALQFALQNSVHAGHAGMGSPRNFPTPVGPQGFFPPDMVHGAMMQNAMKSLYNNQGATGAGANVPGAESGPEGAAKASPSLVPATASSPQASSNADPPINIVEAAFQFQKQLELYREREREKLANQSEQEAALSAAQHVTGQLAAIAGGVQQEHKSNSPTPDSMPGSTPAYKGSGETKRSKRASAA